jgi:hypothetical protein
MTDAERQVRYRAARAVAQPMIRARRSVDRRSRRHRWNDALIVLADLQTEYAAWLDALPENQQDSATTDASRTIAELDSRSSWRLNHRVASAEAKKLDNPIGGRKVVRDGDRPRRSLGARRCRGERAEGDRWRSIEPMLRRTFPTHDSRSRKIVWDRVAEPIWASGHCATLAGRTHERSRHARQKSHRSS